MKNTIIVVLCPTFAYGVNYISNMYPEYTLNLSRGIGVSPNGGIEVHIATDEHFRVFMGMNIDELIIHPHYYHETPEMILRSRIRN